MADQDFIIDNTWFEVKTVSSGANDVQISSVEQLDCETTGELVLLFADKTTKSNQRAQTPISVYRSLIDMMPDSELQFRFQVRLMHVGFYPRLEYDTDACAFEVKGSHSYVVTSDFPCLRRCNLPIAVNNAKYSLSLAVLNPFLKG